MWVKFSLQGGVRQFQGLRLKETFKPIFLSAVEFGITDALLGSLTKSFD
jgi:hypothetical protein